MLEDDTDAVITKGIPTAEGIVTNSWSRGVSLIVYVIDVTMSLVLGIEESLTAVQSVVEYVELYQRKWKKRSKEKRTMKECCIITNSKERGIGVEITK